MTDNDFHSPASIEYDVKPNPCHQKRCPQHCKGKDHYSPNDLKYCRHQVEWLLENFDVLLLKLWPSDHLETGYTGDKGRRRHNASYEQTMMVLSEFVPRLERVGRDMLPLLFAYAKKEDNQIEIRDMLSKSLGIDPYELDERISDAVDYIKGKKPKEMSYREWKMQRKWRNKKAK